MKSFNYLNWFRRLLVVGAVVAGATASVAGAYVPQPDGDVTTNASVPAVVSRPPDVQDAVTALHSTPAGLKAEGLRLQGLAQAYAQGYAHTYRQSESASIGSPTSLGLKAEGMRLQGIAQAYRQSQADSATVVSRPPDISDTALSVQYGSVTQSSTGFDWGDWAIGIGSGLGVALLLGCCFLMARQLRHRVQTA